MNQQNQNQQRTIDAIWPVAKAAALHIKHWHLWSRGAHHQRFGPPHWDGSDYIAAAFAKPGEIEYRLLGGAEVLIFGLDVDGVRPEDVDVGPIEPVGEQKVVRADVLPNRNSTLDDIPWELEYSDLSSQTELDKVAREVGASLTIGFRQQVGYGGELYGASGETELTAQAEASFRQAWEREMTSHREHTVTSKRDIVIRAMHEAVLERVETVGPARQVIRAKGAMKFGIRLHSPGKFWAKWNSLSDFCAVLQGIDAPREFAEGDWLPFYRDHPVPTADLEPFRRTVYAETENVREFESASKVRVDIRSEPLNDEARLNDALRLVALQSPDEDLRKMAATALEAA